MLNATLKYLQNYFSTNTDAYPYDLTFTATDTIASDFSESSIIAGQYIQVDGTLLNNGVYKVLTKSDTEITVSEVYDYSILTEAEVEDASMQVLEIPRDLIAIIDDITTYDATSTDGVASESQGGRSISYANSGGSGWQGIYDSKLSAYRKLGGV